MRKRHGSRFATRSLVTVFWLQGLLLWVISLPLQVGAFRTSSWHALAICGIGLWLFGFAFEAVGDYQLARFKADPGNRGQVMNRGLWRYTRHPNYFGEFLIWWGLFLVAAQADSWWWTITGPALLTFLLIRVSGVNLLESSLRNRVDGYEEYIRTTSAFFPLPPKKHCHPSNVGPQVDSSCRE
jgi:steroid 5-alpha reductase family enzyme